MTDYIECDRGKFCKATNRCPIPKHIKKMLMKRYHGTYICPNNNLIFKEFKNEQIR